MNQMWREIVRDKLKRLRAELDQIERHAEEADVQLTRQTLSMAERSLQEIRNAVG
jgi:hypothetical protein